MGIGPRSSREQEIGRSSLRRIVGLGARTEMANNPQMKLRSILRRSLLPVILLGAGLLARHYIDRWVDTRHAEERKAWLARAVMRGDVQLVASLLEQGFSPDASVLCCAAAHGQAEILKLLMQAGVDVNASDGMDTSLHCAALMGRTEVAKMLVANGADVNAKTARGHTPLLFAVQANDQELVRHLLSHGAQVQLMNADGDTILTGPLNPIWDDKVTPEILRILIQAGADPNEPDRSGRRPLHYVEDERNARVLLEGGADPKVVDADAGTPLHAAAARGNKQVVELLITFGAAIEARDRGGKLPAERASENGHEELATFLRRKTDRRSPPEARRPGKTLRGGR